MPPDLPAMPGPCSARTADAIAFIFAEESGHTQGTAMSGANACLWYRLQLQLRTRCRWPKQGPTSIPPQDNQPFAVLFSAVSARTLPARCVLPSVLPQSCRDATRAGRRQQARQEHSHISDGTFPSHRPLPPLSYLLPFQLRDAETPQKLIQATFRGQRGGGE